MELPKRKSTRLPDYDYSSPGYYFITVCTKGKQKLLCDIVGTGLPDGPKILYTQYGRIVQDQLQFMEDFYDDIRIEKHVVMPNHLHILILISGTDNGPSRRPVPTNSKSLNLLEHSSGFAIVKLERISGNTVPTTM